MATTSDVTQTVANAQRQVVEKSYSLATEILELQKAYALQVTDIFTNATSGRSAK